MISTDSVFKPRSPTLWFWRPAGGTGCGWAAGAPAGWAPLHTRFPIPACLSGHSSVYLYLVREINAETAYM